MPKDSDYTQGTEAMLLGDLIKGDPVNESLTPRDRNRRLPPQPPALRSGSNNAVHRRSASRAPSAGGRGPHTPRRGAAPVVTASDAIHGVVTTPRRRNSLSIVSHHTNGSTGSTFTSSSVGSSVAAAKYQFNVLCVEEEAEIASRRDAIRKAVKDVAYASLLTTTPMILPDQKEGDDTDEGSAEIRCKLAVEWMLGGGGGGVASATSSAGVVDVSSSSSSLATNLHSNLASIGACIHRERRRINLAALRQQKRSRKPSTMTKRQLEESALFLDAIVSSVSIPTIVGANPSSATTILSSNVSQDEEGDEGDNDDIVINEDATTATTNGDNTALHSQLLLRTIVEAATSSIFAHLSKSDKDNNKTSTTSSQKKKKDKNINSKPLIKLVGGFLDRSDVTSTTRSVDQVEMAKKAIIVACGASESEGADSSPAARRQSRHRRKEESAKRDAKINQERPLFTILHDLLQQQRSNGNNNHHHNSGEGCDGGLFNEGFISRLGDVLDGYLWGGVEEGSDDAGGCTYPQLFPKSNPSSGKGEKDTTTASMSTMIKKLITELEISAFSAYTIGNELLALYIAHIGGVLGEGIPFNCDGPISKKDRAASPIPFTLLELLPSSLIYDSTSTTCTDGTTTSAMDAKPKEASMALLMRLTTIQRSHQVLFCAVVLLSISCEMLGDPSASSSSTYCDPSSTSSPLGNGTGNGPDALAEALVGTVEGGGVADALRAPSFLTRFPKLFFMGDAHCQLGLAVRELDRLHQEVLARLPSSLMDDAASWLRGDVAAIFGKVPESTTTATTPAKKEGKGVGGVAMSPAEFTTCVPHPTISSFPMLVQRLVLYHPSSLLKASIAMGTWALGQAPAGCRELLLSDATDTSSNTATTRILVRHCMMKCLELNDGNHQTAWQVLAEELPNGEEITIGNAALSGKATAVLNVPSSTTTTTTQQRQSPSPAAVAGDLASIFVQHPSSKDDGDYGYGIGGGTSSIHERSMMSMASSSATSVAASYRSNRMLVSTLGEIRRGSSRAGSSRSTANPAAAAATDTSLINATNGYFTAGNATARIAAQTAEMAVVNARMMMAASSSAAPATPIDASIEDEELPPPLESATNRRNDDDGEGGDYIATNGKNHQNMEDHLLTPHNSHSPSDPLLGSYLGDHNKTTCYCEAIRCNGGYNHATGPYLLECLWLPLAQSMVFSHNPDVGAEEVLIAVEKDTWYDNVDTEVVSLDKLQILLHILSLERVGVPAAYYELGQLVELGFCTTTVRANEETGAIDLGSVPASLQLQHSMTGSSSFSPQLLLSKAEVEMVLDAADEFMPYDDDKCSQALRMRLEALRRVYYSPFDAEDIVEEICEDEVGDPASTFSMLLTTADERAVLLRVVTCKNIRVVRETKVDVCFDSFKPLQTASRNEATSTTADGTIIPSPLTDCEESLVAVSSSQSLSLSRVDCYCLGLSLVPNSHSGLWMRLAMSMEDIGQCRFKEAVETARSAIAFQRRALAANHELCRVRTQQRLLLSEGEDDVATKKGWSFAFIKSVISTSPLAYLTIPSEYLSALSTTNKVKLIFNDIVEPTPVAEQVLAADGGAREVFDAVCMDVATGIVAESVAADGGRPLGQLLEHSKDVYRRAVMVGADEAAVLGGGGGSDGTFTRLESLVMAVSASGGYDAKAWFVLGTCLGERSLARRKCGLTYRKSSTTTEATTTAADKSHTLVEFPFCSPWEVSPLNLLLQEKADEYLPETVELPTYLLLRHRQDTTTATTNSSSSPSRIFQDTIRDLLAKEDGSVEVDAQECLAHAAWLSPTTMQSLVDTWRRRLGM